MTSSRMPKTSGQWYTGKHTPIIDKTLFDKVQMTLNENFIPKTERIGKRKETIKKRQDSNKAKFIAKLEEMPVIQVAAAQTGIDRSTYYRWRDEDPAFKEDCQKALDHGISFVNDMMESLLIKYAKEGKIAAVIFWLKNHHKLYMEIKRYEHFHKHEFQEVVLTEERKKQIAETMMKWSEPEDGDERDEDYEISDLDEVEEPEVLPKKKKVIRKIQREFQSSPTPSKQRVAKMLKPKRPIK